MQGSWVRSLGWDDPLEKGIATHSCILVWRTTWTEEPGGLQSVGCQESDTNERLSLSVPYRRLSVHGFSASPDSTNNQSPIVFTVEKQLCISGLL